MKHYVVLHSLAGGRSIATVFRKDAIIAILPCTQASARELGGRALIGDGVAVDGHAVVTETVEEVLALLLEPGEGLPIRDLPAFSGEEAAGPKPPKGRQYS